MVKISLIVDHEKSLVSAWRNARQIEIFAIFAIIELPRHPPSVPETEVRGARVVRVRARHIGERDGERTAGDRTAR